MPTKKIEMTQEELDEAITSILDQGGSHVLKNLQDQLAEDGIDANPHETTDSCTRLVKADRAVITHSVGYLALTKTDQSQAD